MVQRETVPCPLCGRRTRAHRRITVEDIGWDGSRAGSGYSTVICRDCAFATVTRAQAGAELQTSSAGPTVMQ